MSIDVVSTSRDFKRVISDVEFTLRRLTEAEEQRLAREYTRRGERDWTAYMSAKLKLVVRGWGRGVVVDGEERAFDADLLYALPDSVKAEIFEAVSEGRPGSPTPPAGPSSSGG